MEAVVSIKIKLVITRALIPSLAEFGVQGVRVVGKVVFKTNNGYSEPRYAIIDTGSPISIIPPRVRTTSKVKILKDYKITGLVDKEECKLPVSFSELTCRLLDEENITDDLPIKADLAYTDELPIILGFADLLDEIVIYIDCKNDCAYLKVG
jgi:hypothetical protein